MNRGFKLMSPKLNSSRLYGCFKLIQIQQKMLARKHATAWSAEADIFIFSIINRNDYNTDLNFFEEILICAILLSS